MIAKGEISESLTFSDTLQMPYLQAVIKESLRIHPTAGLPLQRVVPKGGVQLAGQFFPEGVSFLIRQVQAHLGGLLLSPRPAM